MGVFIFWILLSFTGSELFECENADQKMAPHDEKQNNERNMMEGEGMG
jgi:hypothetical protein